MKISKKLFVLAAMGIGGMLLVAGASCVQIQRIQAGFEEVASIGLPSVAEIGSMANNLGRMRSVADNVAMSGDAGKIPERVAIYAKVKAAFEKSKAHFAKDLASGPEEEKFAAQVDASYQEALPVLERSIELSTKSDFAGASKGMVDGFPKLYALAIILDDGMAVNARRAEESAAGARRAVEQAYWWLGLSLAAVAMASAWACWLIAKSIAGPAAAMARAMKKASADLDLTVDLGSAGDDEVGVASRAIDAFFGTVSKSFGLIQTATTEVSNQARSLEALSGRGSASSHGLSQAASKMAAAIGELSVSISTVSSVAEESRSIAVDSDALAKQGVREIDQIMRAIKMREQVTASAAEKIAKLDQTASGISGLIQTIQSIAEQTNLLALNAAIEAARAGEYGRGFAVVADEVRKLAEQTRMATVEISDGIMAMIDVSQAASEDSRALAGKAHEDSLQIMEFRSTVEKIAESFAQVSQLSERISDAMQEQSAGSSEVGWQVEAVVQGAKQASEDSLGTAASTKELSRVAVEVAKALSVYKTRK